MFGSNNSNPQTRPFGIQDQQTSSNQQGIPAAYFAGTRKIAATWISQVYNLHAVLAPSTGKKGGSGGKGSKGGGGNDPSMYDYYGTVAGAFCVGQVDSLLSILNNGQEVWPGGKPWSVGLVINVNDLYVYDAQTYICQLNHTTSTLTAPPNPTYWAPYVFAKGAGAYDDITITAPGKITYGVMRIYWGTPGQVVEPLLTSGGNDHGDQHPNYQGVCYIVLIDFLLGQGTTTAPNVELVLRRAPTQSIVSGGPATLNDGQANLAAVACEVLTDQNLLGQATGLIDATSWQAAADICDNQTALMAGSPLLDEQMTIRDFFDRMREMTDNFVRFDTTTRTVETGIYRHGTAPVSYSTLTTDHLTERPKLTGGAWTDVRSRSMVRFNDRVISFTDNAVKADDPRAFAVLGEHRTDNLDRQWITRMPQAIAHGAESLRTTGRPLLKAEISVRREIARSIRAGDYLLLDVDLEPGVNTISEFFRVDRRVIGQTGAIKFSLIADNTLAPVAYTGPSTPRLPPQVEVAPITALRIMEGTYGLTGENGAVVVLAQRPDTITSGFHLFFDTSTGGTFSAALGGQTNFACLAALTGAVAAADATIAVSVAAQPDSQWVTQQPGDLAASNDQLLAVLVSVVPSGGFTGQVAEDANGYALIEICSVSASTLTSAGHYTLNVLRGRLDTTAAAFTTANTEVWIIPKASLVAFDFGEFATLRGNRAAGLTPDHGYFRLTSFTYLAEMLLSDATSEYFHFPLRSPSAPNLTLTSPGSLSVSVSPTFPYALQVTGTWASADQDLVDFQILTEKDTDTAPRLIYEEVFTSAPSRAFDQTVWLEKAGTYQVFLRAYNATGLFTEVIITVAASGSGAKVMAPVISYRGVNLGSTEYGYFGRLDAACQTPGSTIHWETRYTLDQAGITYSSWSAAADYPGSPALHIPQFHLISLNLVSGTTTGTMSVTGTQTATGTLTVSGSTSGTLGVSGATTGNLSVSGVAFPSGDSVSGTTSGTSPISGSASGSLTVGGSTAGSMSVSGTLTASGGLTVSGNISTPFPCTFQQFKFWASAAGMTDSDAVTITFQDATYV